MEKELSGAGGGHKKWTNKLILSLKLPFNTSCAVPSSSLGKGWRRMRGKDAHNGQIHIQNRVSNNIRIKRVSERERKKNKG